MPLFKKNISKQSAVNTDTPILDSLGKTSPFQVPENYFSNFEQQIMQQVKFIKPVHPVESFFRNLGSQILQPQFAAAASAVILIGASTILYITGTTLNIESPNANSNKNLPQTVVTVNEDLPEDKLYIASIETKGNESKLLLELSPSITPQQVQAIASSLPEFLSPLQNAQNDVLQYLAANEYKDMLKKDLYNTSKNKDLIKNDDNNSNTPVQNPLQSVYQYHPYYQNVSNPPFVNSSAQTTTQSSNQTANVVNVDSQQSKKPQQNPLPHFALPEIVCSETSYELKPYIISKDHKYVWSTGERTPSITVRSSGTYTLTIYNPDNVNEFVTSTSVVSIVPKPKTSLPSHAVICHGKTLKLEPEIQNPELYKYFWIPTYDTIKDITVKNQGLFVLSITGCNTYFDSVLVTREHCELMIPNVITPNNDGVNDYFYIQGLEKYPGTKLSIYDRSGYQVFSSNNYLNNFSGDNLPNGTYFFILKFSDGLEKHGALTILR